MKLPVCRSLLAAFIGVGLLSGCSGGGGGSPAVPPPGPTPTPVAIAPWTAGVTWNYQVTNSPNTASRTIQILPTGLTNPFDHNPVLEFKDTITAGTTTNVNNDYFFRQATDGSIVLEGVAPSGQALPEWVTASSPAIPIIYPSPMTTGQLIGPYSLMYSNGQNTTQSSTIQRSILSVALIPLPLVPNGTPILVQALRIREQDPTSTTDTWFVPSAAINTQSFGANGNPLATVTGTLSGIVKVESVDNQGGVATTLLTASSQLTITPASSSRRR